MNDLDAVADVLRRHGRKHVGLAVAVRHGDEVSFTGSGVASVGRVDAPGPDTIFELGSITKAFTGTLLAVAVTRGEVRLDDPVTRYLPSHVRLPVRGRAITLEDLATHTSGLPGTPRGLAVRALTSERRNPWRRYDRDRLLAALPRVRLRRRPGGRARYSNLGFGLLGHVLAAASGATYEELLRERVCGPLGLVDTSTQVSAEKTHRFADGHTRRRRPTPHWDLPGLPGAGAIRSTARDVLVFLDANTEPESPIAEAARLAHAPRARMRGRVEVGLGWLRIDLDGRRVVWHSGGTGGFRTVCGFVEGGRLAVVVLANAARSVEPIGIELVRALG